jgi:aspartyl-tRNA(Asn)/glutamyl-tRNA(Gln) amidotransferase subunit B
MEWETVIGLEIHVQLATQSKIFSGASTQFGAAPNTQACAVDLGLPGVLPVLNEHVVKMATQFGLAVNATVAKRSVFARKNYFYPDLPKGYQISQYELPIVANGELFITLENGEQKRIGITRAHLEEDAGKSLHEDFHGLTGIDLNRAGTPLLEIVSEPDLRSAKEAISYLKGIHSIIRYLGISDGNMNEGSMRCDANVSIRRKGQTELGTRAEIKNVNSFKFVEKAINYEVNRQMDVLENGGTIVQETRLYDSDKNETRSMRGKEEANDYRYFPDPDLLPVVIDDAYIEAIRAQLPELPAQKKARFTDAYKLNAYDASILSSDRDLADYFEAVVNTCHDAKLSANWVMVDLTSQLNRHEIDITQCPISAAHLGQLITRIKDNTISGKIAKTIFEKMWAAPEAPDTIIEREGLKQVTDTAAIEKIVEEVLANNATQVENYRTAAEDKRPKMLGFFVGQIMKASQGKANPTQVNALLLKKLQG